MHSLSSMIGSNGAAANGGREGGGDAGGWQSQEGKREGRQREGTIGGGSLSPVVDDSRDFMIRDISREDREGGSVTSRS